MTGGKKTGNRIAELLVCLFFCFFTFKMCVSLSCLVCVCVCACLEEDAPLDVRACYSAVLPP